MARDVIMVGKETFSLPLPKYASMKAYGEVGVYLHAILTLAR